MFLLFMSVANYQNLESQILVLTYDILSISSHSHFYSVKLPSLVKLVPSPNRVSGHLNCSHVKNRDFLFFYLPLQLKL